MFEGHKGTGGHLKGLVEIIVTFPSKADVVQGKAAVLTCKQMQFCKVTLAASA